MASAKDFYQILGIQKNASQDEVKQAYRKLAREHHPDMVKDGDKSTAEKRFKEINEAYQVLSDPQKRKMYDQYGSAAFSGGPNGTGGGAGPGQGQWGPFTYSYSSGGNMGDMGFGDFDPMDVFEQFFGFRGFGGNRGPKKGKNLYYEMRIDFKDAVVGLEKEINTENGKVKVKIPAGILSGMEMKFAGKGMPSQHGGPSGDLFLSIKYAQPEEFEIVDGNLFVQKEISFIDAILGAEIKIPVIDAKERSGVGVTILKIPEGTQFGAKLIVRGRGMPRVNGRGQSDVVVQLYFTMPKKLNREQRRILEEFKRTY